MKRQVLKFDDIKGMLNEDEMKSVLGGITFENWYELIKYISENGVDDQIANTHWDLNGDGGLNRIDIVQKDGLWGFWATTGSASGPDLANGIPGNISVNVNSTWVPVQSPTINNGAKTYLDAINRVYSLGNGYVMGFKNSSDATYENFWNRTYNALTGAVVGAVSGGVSTAVEGVLGSFFGGILVDQLSGYIPELSTNSDTDKVRNDLVLDVLQSNFIANYTPGMTMGGTLRFTNVDLSPIALTIDMKDLIDAVESHMKTNNAINSQGEINEGSIDSYTNAFKAIVEGSGSMVEIIHRLGGTSTRTDSGNNSGSGGAGGGGGFGANLSPAGPGYTEPLPDGTYYPINSIEQPEFFFYYQVPNPSNDLEISSDPVQYINTSTSNGYIQNGVWTDNDGTRWLLLYCDQITDPQNTDGYGKTWAATKLQ